MKLCLGRLSREPLNGGEQSGLEKLSTTEDAIFSPEYDAEATLHISGIRVVLLQVAWFFVSHIVFPIACQGCEKYGAVPLFFENRESLFAFLRL